MRPAPINPAATLAHRRRAGQPLGEAATSRASSLDHYAKPHVVLVRVNSPIFPFLLR
jgi:hypothetical protein